MTISRGLSGRSSRPTAASVVENEWLVDLLLPTRPISQQGRISATRGGPACFWGRDLSRWRLPSGRLRPDLAAEGTRVTDLGATGEATAEQSFAPDVATIAVARRWVDDTLAAWGSDDLGWTAMLLVTELSTNALRHAATAYRVSLDRRKDGTVRTGASDGSPRKPRARDYGVDATTGRGLGLVGSLAAAWGTSSLPDGKTVWCDLRPEVPEGAAVEPDLDAFLSAGDFDLGAAGPTAAGDGSPQVMWAMAA